MSQIMVDVAIKSKYDFESGNRDVAGSERLDKASDDVL